MSSSVPQLVPGNRRFRRATRKRGSRVAAGGGLFVSVLGIAHPAGALAPTTTTLPSTAPQPSASSNAQPQRVTAPPAGQAHLQMVPPSETPQGNAPPQGNTVAPLAQEQNDNLYVFFNWAGATNFTNFQQLLYPQALVPSTFWATSWLWNGSSYGGYLGLQTDANGNGVQALFSAWTGTNGVNGWGASCGQFNEGGTGIQCFVPFTYSSGHTYRFDVTKVGGDGQGGYDWRGSIYDFSANTEYKVGLIDVPSLAATTGEPDNFSEYFGNTFACGTSPVSWVQWTPPAAQMNGSGGFDYNSTIGTYLYGGDPCSSYSVSNGSYGSQPYVNAKLGG